MIAERLKKSILQSAIQGKLTKQLPEDGDARILLENIRKEKKRLTLEGKIKKEISLRGISEEEIPFDIPENWCWVRLADLAVYKKGPFGSSLTKDMFISDGENSIKVYEQKNAIQKDVTLGNYFIDAKYYEKVMGGFSVIGGDIIISCAGTIGESFILPENARIGVINQALMRVRVFEGVCKQYFIEVFDYAINSKNAQSKGSAIKNIPPFDILKSLIVPLPPFSEQLRIVSKLSDLRDKIENLKNDENKIEKLHIAFPRKMVHSILRYAIQGKLTKQLPEDGNAGNILIEIDNEKSNLSMGRKIKNGHLSKKINPKDIPFDIPENWRWCYLEDVSLKIHYGYNASASNSGNAKLLRISDIQNNQVSWNQVPYCSIKDNQLDNYKLQDRDIVIARTGGTIGKTYIVKNLLGTAIFASYLIRVIPSLHINEEYLKYYMESDLYWRQLIEKSQGTGQPNVNGESLKNLMLPLPPKAEQIRIVEKIREILPYIKSI